VQSVRLPVAVLGLRYLWREAKARQLDQWAVLQVATLEEYHGRLLQDLLGNLLKARSLPDPRVLLPTSLRPLRGQGRVVFAWSRSAGTPTK